MDPQFMTWKTLYKVRNVTLLHARTHMNSGVARRGKWGHAPWGAAWGRTSTLFAVI